MCFDLGQSIDNVFFYVLQDWLLLNVAGCCQKLKYAAGCLNSGSTHEAQGVYNQCPNNSIPPDPIGDLSTGGASCCKRAGEIDVVVLF